MWHYTGRLTAKILSASCGLHPPSPPEPLTRGSAPGYRWGHSSQSLAIGLRYRARHVAPNLATLATPLDVELASFLRKMRVAIRETNPGVLRETSTPLRFAKFVGRG